MRDIVTSFIGWVPTNILESKRWDLAQLREDTRKRIETTDDPFSKHAQELINAQIEAEKILETASANYEKWREKMLNEINLHG